MITDNIYSPGVTVTLSLGNPAGTVLEGRGFMLVIVEIAGQLKTDVVVAVQTYNGSGRNLCY